MIRERKCLRSFRVRTELGDKQLKHKKAELDNHICIVRVLKRPQDSAAHPARVLKEKKLKNQTEPYSKVS